MANAQKVKTICKSVEKKKRKNCSDEQVVTLYLTESIDKMGASEKVGKRNYSNTQKIDSKYVLSFLQQYPGNISENTGEGIPLNIHYLLKPASISKKLSIRKPS